MVFICLILATVLLVVAGIAVKLTRKSKENMDLPKAKSLVQEKECEGLEYKYKYLRAERRRHIATIYFLNKDR